MHRRQLLIALPLASLPLARPAFAAGEIGVSLRSSGESSLMRDGALSALTAGTPLFERDLVRTASASFAALRLNSATDIHLGPDSEVEIDRYLADIGGELSIAGAVVLDRPDDLPKIDLTLRSAYAQIGVRGTRFFAGPSKGAFAVFVERGSVTVQAGSQTVTLIAGDGVTIPAAGDPPGPVTAWTPARIAEAFASVGL